MNIRMLQYQIILVLLSFSVVVLVQDHEPKV